MKVNFYWFCFQYVSCLFAIIAASKGVESTLWGFQFQVINLDEFDINGIKRSKKVGFYSVIVFVL